jgi:hypothetical protein
MVRWLRDTVAAEGNIAAEDVARLAMCDHIEPAVELLEDTEHRRPRAA